MQRVYFTTTTTIEISMISIYIENDKNLNGCYNSIVHHRYITHALFLFGTTKFDNILDIIAGFLLLLLFRRR